MSKKILLAAGLIVTAALVLQAKNYRVANTIPSTDYFNIKPKGSYRCLGVENDRRGGRLILTSCSANGAKWKIYKSANGVYRLRPRTGGYLGIQNIKKSKSAAVNASRYEKVKFLAKSDDTFFIKLDASGMVLDIAGDIRKSGTRVIQYKFHGKTNQQWQLRFVDNRKLFNMRTYRPVRRSSGTSYSRNTSGSRVTLQNSLLRGSYAIERYFKACSSSQLRSENQNDELVSFLGKLTLTKRLSETIRVIKGTRENSSSSVRSMTYRSLLRVDYAGGNFVEKLAKSAVKKEINKALRVETTSYSNKKYLNELSQKMK